MQGDDPTSSASSVMNVVRQSGPALLQRVQQGLSKFQLVYAPHPSWPLPSTQAGSQNAVRKPLRISILDSSFNPPTLAHLALANSRRSEALATGESIVGEESLTYDAKLLLLSVKNADKTLKPGDATYQQRLEMMGLLTQDVQPDGNPNITTTLAHDPFTTAPERANVAIAVIDEPTFVGKANAFLDFLKSRLHSLTPSVHINVPQDVESTFIVGLDTLERLFAPRYYASEAAMLASLRKFFSPGPEGDNARVVCAHRVLETSTSSEPQALSLAQEFIDAGRIATIELSDDVKTYSSTAVRNARSGPGMEHDALWRKWVTRDVAQYITEHGLYQESV